MRFIYTFYLSSVVSLLWLTCALPIYTQDPIKRAIIQKRTAYFVVPVDGRLASTSPTENVQQIETTTQTFDNVKTVTIPLTTLRGPTRTILFTKSLTYSTSDETTIPFRSRITHTVKKKLTPSSKASVIVVSVESPQVTPLAASNIFVNPGKTNSKPTAMPIPKISLSSTIRVDSMTQIRSTINLLFTSTLNESSHTLHTSRNMASIYNSRPSATTEGYDNGLWHTSYPLSKATLSASYTPSKTIPTFEMPSPTSKIFVP